MIGQTTIFVPKEVYKKAAKEDQYVFSMENNINLEEYFGERMTIYEDVEGYVNISFNGVCLSAPKARVDDYRARMGFWRTMWTWITG